MFNRLITTLKGKVTRRYIVAAFAVLGLTIGAVLMSVYLEFSPLIYIQKETEDPEEQVETVAAYTLTESNPTRLRIPKIEVDAAFESPLGVDENKEIQVPEGYETVGWYKYGPTPGELGPAVILGHVDSYKGPAVLYSLGKLEVGDEILIDREDGTTATFEVIEMERESQNDFPTRKVYGDLDYAGLRLITCTGVYNHGTLRYSHNLIVYAKLKEPVPENGPAQI